MKSKGVFRVGHRAYTIMQIGDITGHGVIVYLLEHGQDTDLGRYARDSF